MRDLRVAFIDQVGNRAGGAEETLATFIANVNAGLRAHAILFEDGAFADRLRAAGVLVDVVAAPPAIRSSTRERWHAAVVRAPGLALRVAALLRRRNIDLSYTNSMKAHFVGALASRMAGLPCVMHFHDVIGGTALAALRLAAELGSRERIACSHVVSRIIGLNKTSVIYGPVDLESYARLPERRAVRARLGLPQDLPVVALVGRINRWKGHDRFLRIAARVLARVPAHFTIVGAPLFRDADFVPELHALVNGLGIGHSVSFLPWQDDVREIYAAADLNVNCSVREPFGRAAIEASACGVPTICFDDSGAAETIVDGVTGRTFPAGDEDAFAAGIVELLESPVTLRRIGAAARERSGRFDARHIAAQMAAVIRRSAA